MGPQKRRELANLPRIRSFLPQKASPLFVRFFASYCAILLIAFGIWVALYSSSVRVIESIAKKSALAILEQTRDIVDNRLAELDSTARQIALSQRTLSVLSMDRLEEGSPSYYNLWSFWRDLPDYSLANSFISSFYIILPRAGVVVSAREIMSDDATQYERELKYRDWSYGRWETHLLSAQRNRELLPGVVRRPGLGGAARGIYYLQSLNLESRRSPAGAFLVLIDGGSIEGLLKRLDTGERGLVLISDASGELVSSSAGAKCRLDVTEAARLSAKGEISRLEGAGYIVSRASSDLAKWSFVSILPRRMVLAEAFKVRNLALALLALGLAAGLAASAFFARHSAQPIRDMARKVTGLQALAVPSGCRDELEYLDEAFDGLIAAGGNLRAELERQAPVLRADVARRLILGLYGNEAEALALAGSAGLALDGRTFLAAAIRIEGYRELSPRVLEELKVLRAAIAEALHASGLFEALPYEQEDSLVAVLLASPRAAAEEAGELLASIAETLASGYHARLSWALGEGVSSLVELPFSYSRARSALEREARASASGSAAGAGGAEAEQAFWFPIEAEMRLVAAIRGADGAALASTLRESARENLGARRLSERMFRDFAAAFRVAVVRGVGPSGGRASASLAAETAEALSAVDAADRGAWFDGTEAVLRSLLEQIASSRTSQRRDLADAVAARLAELYADPALTLYAVAREFDFSESSFYHFFRESFGRSFADYLEDLRIRQACARLGEGRIAIKDVSAAVGFASDTTFRRAFHRVVGLSPSEYARGAGTTEK